MSEFRIGELSRQSGISIQTIRFYERIGLLSEPRRNRQNQRYYTTEAVDEIGFVKRAQALGFTLSEIEKMKYAVDCEDVRPISQAAQSRMFKQMTKLSRAHEWLSSVCNCDGSCNDCDCPMLKLLHSALLDP